MCLLTKLKKVSKKVKVWHLYAQFFQIDWSHWGRALPVTTSQLPVAFLEVLSEPKIKSMHNFSIRLKIVYLNLISLHWVGLLLWSHEVKWCDVRTHRHILLYKDVYSIQCNIIVCNKILFNMGTMNCPDCPICYKHLLEISTRPSLLRPLLCKNPWPIKR